MAEPQPLRQKQVSHPDLWRSCAPGRNNRLESRASSNSQPPEEFSCVLLKRLDSGELFAFQKFQSRAASRKEVRIFGCDSSGRNSGDGIASRDDAHESRMVFRQGACQSSAALIVRFNFE